MMRFLSVQPRMRSGCIRWANAVIAHCKRNGRLARPLVFDYHPQYARHHESSNPSHMAAFPVAESLHTRAHRSLARRHLPSLVDVDLDIGLRRAGNAARDTADRGGADACRADADGPVDGDGNRALRTVLLADGSVARSRPEITGVRGRRIADLVR